MSKINRKNWSQTLHLHAKTHQATTVEDVRRVLQRAIEQQSSIRALSKAYSSSWVIAPDGANEEHLATGAFLDVTGLLLPGTGTKVCTLSSYPSEWYSGNFGPDELVHVSAGAKIDDVNRYLAKEDEPNAAREKRALPMMGAFSGQSFVGAMSTSTHGTGISHEPLPGMVVSVDLMTIVEGEEGHKVVLWRIEPTEGGPTTDLFPHAQLIRDDDLFDAVRVSFGTMGIITSVIVKTEPAFHLTQHKELLSWREAKRRLRDIGPNGEPKAFKGYYAVDVVMNPYPDDSGTKDEDNMYHRPTCVWTTFTKEETAPPEAAPPTQPSHIHTALSAINTPFQHPREVPHIMDEIIRETTEPALQHGRSDHILTNPKEYAQAGFGGEWSFLAAGPSYIYAIDDMLSYIARAGKDEGRYLAGFFALRFSKGTKAFLSMSHGEGPFCYLEVLSSSAYGDGRLLMEELETTALHHDGRPHWGQILAVKDKLKFDPTKVPNICHLYKSHNQNGALERWYTQVKRVRFEYFINDFGRLVIEAASSAS